MTVNNTIPYLIATIALVVIWLIIWKFMKKGTARTWILRIVVILAILCALGTVLGVSFANSTIHIVESTPTLMSYPPQ